MEGFFKDLKVIELSSVLAGPSAGMFFAELGATVIKVENKRTGGDVTRTWRIPGESANGPSAYFSSVNYKKQYLHLDLTQPADHATLMHEVRTADIVLSNYQRHTAQKLGTTYQDLTKVRPDLIFLQLDGFMESDRPAFDVVLQAETGWISMNGTGEHEPAKLPVALIDIIAGHQLKEAALLAIIHKMRTGQGAEIHVNLEQASLSALANQACNYLMEGAIAEPIGTLHPNIAPYGDWFATADGRKVVLAVGSDTQFHALCSSLKVAHLNAEPRFATNPQRVVNRQDLGSLLAPAIAAHTLSEIENLWKAANIPYGVVRSIDEVLGSKAAKQMLLHEQIEGKYTSRLSSVAFKSSF